MNKNTKSLLWGIAAGSVIGSVTALLFAPKSGKELRKDISDGAVEAKDKAQELITQVTDKGTEWAGIVKESALTIVHEISDWGKTVEAGDEEKVTVSSNVDAAVEAAATLEIAPKTDGDSSEADDGSDKA
ncbi:YtxH domain-containing protein [Paenibacillus sp. HN-1]|uniref:YtxH domain-containing protein n=1 Tax=Paenibacillus TaxID=44249 RepID=UPI001CAA19B2|nr:MULTISPECIES: YtxH domain-containing protein [Paenibacillus]MBY9082521.1 YtxH domain-containing protein [Paenibacillus sp. CGMCC 1.18879]MBY9084880.1 YtxH domain-containing protein [Paenibacillus sinensis]